MGITGRVYDFYGRNGFKASMQRVVLEAKRAVMSSRMLVFYCDLFQRSSPPVIESAFTICQIKVFSVLTADDVDRITGFWDPKEALRRIHERFSKHASLWLVREKYDGKIVAFGWSMQGATIEPYFFPLGSDDVYLFDFHVYEEYRGRGVNPLLVEYILSSVAKTTIGRAFIDCAEWNYPQLASLRKTRFRPLGLAKNKLLFGRVTTRWWNTSLVQSIAVHAIQKNDTGSK